LQESEKQFCNPNGFCFSFKDYEGNRTNTNVQMDSQEFLNMLFDRIDTTLKGSKDAFVLKEVLEGVFTHQLIPRVRCRLLPNLNLNLTHADPSSRAAITLASVMSRFMW